MLECECLLFFRGRSSDRNDLTNDINAITVYHTIIIIRLINRKYISTRYFIMHHFHVARLICIFIFIDTGILFWADANDNMNMRGRHGARKKNLFVQINRVANKSLLSLNVVLFKNVSPFVPSHSHSYCVWYSKNAQYYTICQYKRRRLHRIASKGMFHEMFYGKHAPSMHLVGHIATSKCFKSTCVIQCHSEESY